MSSMIDRRTVDTPTQPAGSGPNPGAPTGEKPDNFDYERWERLYNANMEMLRKRDEHVNLIKDRRKQKEEQACTFSPEISKKAKHLMKQRKKGVDYVRKSNYEWREGVERRIEKKRRRKERLIEKRREKSKICRNSKKLLEDKEYKNPIQKWDEEFEKFKYNKQEYKREPLLFTPEISEKSKDLTRGRRSSSSSNVFNKLYNEHIEKKEKLQKRQEELNVLRSPIILTKKLKRSKERDKNIFAHLYNESKQRKEDLEKKMKDRYEKLMPNNNMVKSSTNSRKILKNAKTLRNYSLYEPRKIETKNEKENNIYVPKRLKHELEENFDDFIKRNKDFLDKKERHHLTKRNEKKMDEARKCTFTPKTNKKRNKRVNSKLYTFQKKEKKNEEEKQKDNKKEEEEEEEEVEEEESVSLDYSEIEEEKKLNPVVKRKIPNEDDLIFTDEEKYILSQINEEGKLYENEEKHVTFEELMQDLQELDLNDFSNDFFTFGSSEKYQKKTEDIIPKEEKAEI